MEKYYFEIDADLNCKEECNYFSIEDYDYSDNVKVGSMACKQCQHNVSYCGDEKWIKCEIYSAFEENYKLREESEARFKYIIEQTKKIEQLEKEIASLKGGL